MALESLDEDFKIALQNALKIILCATATKIMCPCQSQSYRASLENFESDACFGILIENKYAFAPRKTRRCPLSFPFNPQQIDCFRVPVEDGIVEVCIVAKLDEGGTIPLWPALIKAS